MSKVIDHRKLSPEAQTQIRTVAIKRREAGESADAAARSLGCARSAVFAWQQRYRAGGWAALVNRQRPGAQPRIDWMALLQVKGCEHTPAEYPLPGKWWTRVLVQALIERTFGTRYGLPQISHFLHRLGLSPTATAAPRAAAGPGGRRALATRDLPGAGGAGAPAQGTHLVCRGVGGGLDAAHTTWGRQGETPVVRDTAERFGWNLLSAISPRGECRFEVTARRGTAALFIAFLDQRRAGQERPLLLIVDNHPRHRSRAVQASGQRTPGERELRDAPPYAPEPKPDEWLRNDLKTQGVDRLKFTSTFALKRLIATHLQHLQNLPAKITSFFLGKPREYIAQSGLLVTD